MENSWKKTLYLVWFVQILSLMSFSFGLPFLPYYIQDLGVVDPEKVRLFTGILSAAPAIGMGIMAPVRSRVAITSWIMYCSTAGAMYTSALARRAAKISSWLNRIGGVAWRFSFYGGGLRIHGDFHR